MEREKMRLEIVCHGILANTKRNLLGKGKHIAGKLKNKQCNLHSHFSEPTKARQTDLSEWIKL